LKSLHLKKTFIQIILQNLYFKFEGTKRQACYCEADKKIHEDNFYSILKEEWNPNFSS